MKFIFCIILSAIGMACYSKNPIKIENGIYVNKSGSKLMEIKNDTLTLRSSSIESGQSTPLAICKITKAGKAFFEINSVDGSVLSAFKNISITEDTQDDKISSKITFEVPNTTMPIKFNVYCGTILYSAIAEKGKCSIILNKNRTNSPDSLSFAFQPVYYNESNPAGQFFGVLFYEYPYKIGLKKRQNIVVRLSNVTDELFEQYYLSGEYINVMPNGIKWKGDFFERQ